MFGRRHRRIAQAEAAAAKRVVKKQQAALMPAKKPILLRLFNRFSNRFPRVTGANLQMALLVLAFATVANTEEAILPACSHAAESMGVSVMLMGAISVMMSIFYLVNVDDEDFKKYSWTVISATISIFAAVLVFSGINGCVEYFLLPDCGVDETPEINGCYEEGEDKERMELIVNFTHLGVWWTLLQFTLATITGAIEPFEALPCCKRKQIDALPDEEIASHVHAKVEEHVIQASKHLMDQKALGNKGWDAVHLEKAVDKAKPWLRQQVHAQYLQAQRHGHEVNEELLQEKALTEIDHMVEKMDSESTRMKLCLKSYAVLMGHTTGFAAINAWGTVQQQTTGEDKDDVLMAWLCVPLAFCVTFSIQLLMDKARDYIALGDDGIKDESEVLWDEAVEETEDDVMSLACSFLMAQAMRLTVCGDWKNENGESQPSTLPNGEGGEDEYREKHHPPTECALLFFAGLAVMCLDMARYIYSQKGKKGPETNLDGTDQEEEKEPRVGVQVRNITMMFFSWCVYFSSDWTVKGTVAKVPVLGENAMMGQTFLALSLTGISFFAIFVLDKIADSDRTPAAADKCIEEAVFSLAFLIGFGWEKTFDMAVEQIAEYLEEEEKLKPDCITKLVLGMLLALLVIPAWRLYILPNIIAYEEAEEAEKETEKETEKEYKMEEKQKAQNLSTVVSRGLDEPLLSKAPKKDRTDKLYPSIATVGQAKVAMRDMEALLIKERKEHTDAKLKNETIDAVIAKNQQNEATIDGFSREVNELQKLTEKLTSGV